MNSRDLKKYKYIAIDTNNKEIKGILLAYDEEDLRQILIQSNLYLKSCKSLSNRDPYKIKNNEIAIFSRELSIMIAVGIPITEALSAFIEQNYSKPFKKALIDVCSDVRSGMLLSKAFSKHKKFFPELFTGMIYIGEISGSLDNILNELAEYYEKENLIKKKAQSALVYPTILSILTFSLIIALITLIIPIFKTTLEKLGTAMPPLTAFLLNLSDWFIANIRFIIIGVAVLILTIYLLFKIDKVQYFCDVLKTKLPIINTVTINLTTSKFARGFCALITGGVDITKSLEIMGDLIENKYIKKKYMTAFQNIKNGHEIALSFRKYTVFPELLIQMLAIGEKSGSMNKIFKRATIYFDNRVEASLSRVTMLLEPIIICIMGAIIALVMLSVFTPLINIINTFGK